MSDSLERYSGVHFFILLNGFIVLLDIFVTGKFDFDENIITVTGISHFM